MLCAPWYDKAQQSLWQPGTKKGMGPTQTPTHNFQKLYPRISGALQGDNDEQDKKRKGLPDHFAVNL